MSSLTLSLRARGAGTVLDLEADDLRARPLDDLGADSVVPSARARSAARPAPLSGEAA